MHQKGYLNFLWRVTVQIGKISEIHITHYQISFLDFKFQSWSQPLKFALALCNCQGFCQGNQGFFPFWLSFKIIEAVSFIEFVNIFLFFYKKLCKSADKNHKLSGNVVLLDLKAYLGKT